MVDVLGAGVRVRLTRAMTSGQHCGYWPPRSKCHSILDLLASREIK